jgi:hypothetical protein
VRIATKVGSIVNEDARVLERMTADPDEIEASLDGSRRRLRRDRIDIVLLHLNSLPIADAHAIFDRLEALRARGWIGHHGWSTDFPDRVAAMAGRPGLAAVEHAMNVFFAAEAIGAKSARHGLLPPGFRTVERSRTSSVCSRCRPSRHRQWRTLDRGRARPRRPAARPLACIASGRTSQFGALLAERRQRHAESAASRQD